MMPEGTDRRRACNAQTATTRPAAPHPCATARGGAAWPGAGMRVGPLERSTYKSKTPALDPRSALHPAENATPPSGTVCNDSCELNVFGITTCIKWWARESSRSRYFIAQTHGRARIESRCYSDR